MKLKFDPSLQYQQDAVDAVVKVFDGQPYALSGAMAFQALQIGGLFQTELGLANRCTLMVALTTPMSSCSRPTTRTASAPGLKSTRKARQDRRPAKLWVKQGDDLFHKSGDRETYRHGCIVQNIDCTPGSEYVEFNQGRILELGQETGGAADDIMKAQVYETVEQHLKKERALKGKGIKVLSLFFIDRVANYRIYNEDGTTSLGKIGVWFEEAYNELTAKPMYKGLIPFDFAQVHNGYFSQDKQGHAKDTRGNTADDDDTYNLIMRDKERLLDPEVALRFIFSHSALREGWDNPNVFQICTLNETQSA